MELKTSSQSYSQLRVDISLQFSIYAYLLAYHHQADEVGGAYEVLVKTKQPKLQRLNTSRNAQDFDRLFRTIKQVLESIDRDAFYPIRSHMYCPGCDYTRVCASW